MAHTTTLHNAEQAHQILRQLWDWAKPRLMAGHKLTLSVADEKRTKPQNDHIHPLVRAIAKQSGYTDEDQLRMLLVEQWRAETGRQKQFARSLDGSRMVDTSNRTKSLDKADCAELIDWLYAWGAQNGVEWNK